MAVLRLKIKDEIIEYYVIIKEEMQQTKNTAPCWKHGTVTVDQPHQEGWARKKVIPRSAAKHTRGYFLLLFSDMMKAINMPKEIISTNALLISIDITY